MDELGCRAPVLAHRTITFKNKKTGRKTAGSKPGLFSYLFNVAASRPAKSPRDKAAILLGCACVNSRSLVLSGRLRRGTQWPAKQGYWPTARLPRCTLRDG
ncbi:hypothetical protein EKH55_0129 [Sinorhizobium alkalisoli]|nr:hypothetical protein EKH55_0129 [Sinorhizobium alkalisoli]